MEQERSIVDSRREQMFPTLRATEVSRLRRFGEVRTYPAGTLAARSGEIAPGLQVILRGEVMVTPHEELIREHSIVTHGPGGFLWASLPSYRAARHW